MSTLFSAHPYDSGAVRFEFSHSTPEDVKRAVYRWAKKRGLKVAEAGLSKSMSSGTTVLFVAEANRIGSPLKSVHFDV